MYGPEGFGIALKVRNTNGEAIGALAVRGGDRLVYISENKLKHYSCRMRQKEAHVAIGMWHGCAP